MPHHPKRTQLGLSDCSHEKVNYLPLVPKYHWLYLCLLAAFCDQANIFTAFLLVGSSQFSIIPDLFDHLIATIFILIIVVVSEQEFMICGIENEGSSFRLEYAVNLISLSLFFCKLAIAKVFLGHWLNKNAWSTYLTEKISNYSINYNDEINLVACCDSFKICS